MPNANGSLIRAAQLINDTVVPRVRSDPARTISPGAVFGLIGPDSMDASAAAGGFNTVVQFSRRLLLRVFKSGFPLGPATISINAPDLKAFLNSSIDLHSLYLSMIKQLVPLPLCDILLEFSAAGLRFDGPSVVVDFLVNAQFVGLAITVPALPSTDDMGMVTSGTRVVFARSLALSNTTTEKRIVYVAKPAGRREH